MKVKDTFFERGSFNIGNGESARFWEDTWLGDTPLAHQYPSLYNIVQRKEVLVSDVMTQLPLNIGFRQALSGNRADRWVHLVHRLMYVHLSICGSYIVECFSQRIIWPREIGKVAKNVVSVIKMNQFNICSLFVRSQK
jgi:hypothetical protein